MSSKLVTEMIPGCCSLKTVRYLKCLGLTDDLSKEEAAKFDTLTEKKTADSGNWASYAHAPETIAIVTDNPSYNKPEEIAKQRKFLEKKGWQLMGSWVSMEGVERGLKGARVYMYGSPGIKVAA